MTSELGHTCRAASAIDPPMRPRPTMPIRSKTGFSPALARPGWMTGRFMTDSDAPSAPGDLFEADRTADRGRDDPQLGHQAVELGGEHRLCAVAERVIGIDMD